MRKKSKEKTLEEILTYGYMPERFSTGYLELVRLALKTEPSAQQFNNESSSPKKKYHQHDGGLKDEGALRFKAWVDRQLRAIGRDVQAYLNARDTRGPSPIGMSDRTRKEIARELEQQIELKCHGCGQYVSWQWTFCAWCGKGVKGGKKQSHDLEGGGSSEQEATADRQQQSSGGAWPDVARENGAEAGRDVERPSGIDGHQEPCG